MSGHSHSSNVKDRKNKENARKSREFGKLVMAIQAAAVKGSDPSANPTLRSLIQKAREINMPSDNVDRAIARGSATRRQT